MSHPYPINYIKYIVILLLSYYFGIYNVLIPLYTYYVYQSNYPRKYSTSRSDKVRGFASVPKANKTNQIFKLTFLLSCKLFGLKHSFIYLFMFSIYEIIYKWNQIIKMLYIQILINSLVNSDIKIIKIIKSMKYHYLYILKKIDDIYSTKTVTYICEKIWKYINYGNEFISSIVQFMLNKMFNLIKNNLHNIMEHFMEKIMENIKINNIKINNINNNTLVIDKIIDDEITNLDMGKIMNNGILDIDINKVLSGIEHLFKMKSPEEILNMTGNMVDELKKEFDNINNIGKIKKE